MTYLASAAGVWVNRAHQAWGASRQWNVGSSFEADLASMTTDRNTWHTRADSAWGVSRVWSSGESWEAAYARVLPAGSGASPLMQQNQNAALTANGGSITWSTVTSNDSWGSSTTLTCPRTGFYVVTFSLRMPATGNVDDAFETTILKNGSSVSNGRTMAQGAHGSGWNAQHNYFAYVEPALIPVGTNYRVTILCSDNGRSFPAGNGVFSATFVPTQTYPH